MVYRPQWYNKNKITSTYVAEPHCRACVYNIKTLEDPIQFYSKTMNLESTLTRYAGKWWSNITLFHMLLKCSSIHGSELILD